MNITPNLLGHLPFLAAVSRHQSFTRAAESLHLTQAAVSYQIRQLEQKLGVTLVIRQSGSRLHLTHAGNQLAAKYMACERQLESTISSISPSGLSGVVKLTSPVDLASLVMPSVLVEMKRIAPNLQVEMHVSDDLMDLTDGTYDLAIRSHNTGASLIHHHLTTSRKSLVASPEYLDRHGSPKNLSDLINHALLIRGHKKNSDENISWHQLLEKTAINLNEAPDTIILGNTFALVEGARAGLGVAIVPDFASNEAHRQNHLVSLFSDYSDALTIDFYLSYFPTPQAESYKTPLIKAFQQTMQLDRFKGAFRGPDSSGRTGELLSSIT